eukprot:PhF_6_TR13600/c0_g1_i1/m.21764
MNYTSITIPKAADHVAAVGGGGHQPPTTTSWRNIFITFVAFIVVGEILVQAVAYHRILLTPTHSSHHRTHNNNNDTSDKDVTSQDTVRTADHIDVANFIPNLYEENSKNGPNAEWRVLKDHTTESQGITIYAVVDTFSMYIITFRAVADWGIETDAEIDADLQKRAARVVGDSIMKSIGTWTSYGKGGDMSRRVATAAPLLWGHLYKIFSCNEDVEGGYIQKYVQACKNDNLEVLTQLLNGFPKRKWNTHIEAGPYTPETLWKTKLQI